MDPQDLYNCDEVLDQILKTTSKMDPIISKLKALNDDYGNKPLLSISSFFLNLICL